jgi:hypothetical protein
MSGSRNRLSHKRARRFRLGMAAGLLALVLQILVPVMPAAAMAQAMDLAASTPEEAASFAATCLALGRPDVDPGVDHQAKCPICFSLAQGQGFSPPLISVATVFAWSLIAQASTLASLAADTATSAFASRAPPLA